MSVLKEKHVTDVLKEKHVTDVAALFGHDCCQPFGGA
jgi:hypothetical protein